jgi:DNA-binding GntR family transcriptional regulator
MASRSADEIRETIEQRIVEGEFANGERLDEVKLATRFGVSRTPLREALKVLANEGLVRLAPGRGAYVTELSSQEVDSLFPVLAMLEARCAAEAVRRLGVSDLRRLDVLHQKMERHVADGDAAAYHRAADELHALLHQATGNPWLQRATADLRRFLRLARGMSRQGEARLLQSLAEHRTLMKAVSRGDAEGAEQIMHHHLLAQQKAWRAARAAGTGAEGASGVDAPAATRSNSLSVAAHSQREAESVGV